MQRRSLFHQHASEWDGLKELLAGTEPKGLCLSIPVADADTSQAIRAAGFEPVEADIYPPPQTPESANGCAACIAADFTAPFPFRDASFNAVVSRGGLEHHPSHMHFISECSRVLKPGGWLLISTTNMQNLRSRATQMLGGQNHYHFKRPPICELLHERPGPEEGKTFDGHVYCVGYFGLRYMLHKAGFRIDTIATGRYSTSAIALAPLLLPPIWLATRRYLNKWLSKHTEQRKEISRHIFSRELLFGKHFILLARKRDEG